MSRLFSLPEFNVRTFKPRESVIEEVRMAVRQKALEKANACFD